MTRGKKITITSIGAVILLLLIGFTCFLFTSPKNQTMKIGDFYCQKTEDGLIIVGTDKLKAEQLIIPEKLNDMPVVGIADNAFKGCEIKNYIVYPNIKRVGEHAFDGNSDFNIIMMKRTDLSDMKVANEWNGIGKIVFNNPTPNPIETSEPKIKVKPIIPGDKSTDSKNINSKPTIKKENKNPEKKARTLKDIKISSPPIKTEYIEGETFDINGIIVTAQYTDGSSTIIDNFWYSKEKLVNGQNPILIEYEERGIKSSTKQAIKVIAKTPIKLEVTTPPTKVDYIEGDIFETVGLIAKVTYNNGDTANVTKFTVPSDKLFKGQNSVNISYTENNKTVSAEQKITVREKSPIALIIATPPNKTQYIEKEVFSSIGMVVKVNFDNNTTAIITNYIHTLEPLSENMQYVEISYTANGKTVKANQPITITKKVPTSLKIVTPPTKVEYIEGNVFNKTGMVVEVGYSNGNTAIVTDYKVSNDKLVLGQKSVTISYKENDKEVTANQDINVAAKTPTKIEVTTPPTKTDYVEGTSFNPEGMITTVTYDNGNTAVITPVYDNKELVFEQEFIELSYKENNKIVKVNQPITVTKKVPTSLKIVTPPSKVEYIEGNVFDKTGMVVEVTYNNENTAIVSNYKVSADKLVLGQKSITISYKENDKEVTANQDINVVAKTPTKLEVTTPPTKTDYIEGTLFNPQGLVVTVTYDNENTAIVTDYKVSTDKLVLGQKSVTISYKENDKEVTANQDINVAVKTPTKLEVTTPPTKVDYVEGSLFNPEGLVVKVTYDNEDTVVVTPSYDNKELVFEQKFIELSYAENNNTVKVNQPITVTKKVPTSLKIVTPPSKVEYIEEQYFDDTGMVVEVEYNNGKKDVVTNYTFDEKPLVVGQKNIEISCVKDGKPLKNQQAITVRKKKLAGIHLEYKPHKLIYTEGEIFNPEGISISLWFDNGTSKFGVTECEYSKEKLLESMKEIEISYTYDGIRKSEMCPITVNPQMAVYHKYLAKNVARDITYDMDTDFTTDGEQRVYLDFKYENGQYKLIGDEYRVGFWTSVEGNRYVYFKKYGTGEENKLHCIYIEDTTSYSGGTQTGGRRVYYYGLVTKVEYNVTKQGEFLRNIEAKNGSLPENGLHTDGYWYVFKNLASDTTAKKTPVKLEVYKQPNKTNYIEDMSFDKTGLAVKVTYDDNSSKTTDNVLVSGGLLQFNQSFVTVTYTENNKPLTVDVPITVTKKTPLSMEVVKTPSKTVYVEGTSFNSTGIEVKVSYDNGKTLNTSSITYDTKNLVLGDKVVKIAFTENGKTIYTDVPITVVKKSPVSLSVLKSPARESYVEGIVFDNTGMEVGITYDNGDVIKVTEYTYYTSNLAVGMSEILLSYVEDGKTFTCIVPITVNIASPISLSIARMPVRTSYVEDTTFNNFMLVCRVTYDNGVTFIKSHSELTITNGDLLFVGQTHVVANYTENTKTVSCNVPITVVQKTPVSLSIKTMPNKTKYKDGEWFDSTGLEIDCLANNGKTYPVPIEKFSPLISFGMTDIPYSFKYNNKAIDIKIPITVENQMRTYKKYQVKKDLGATQNADPIMWRMFKEDSRPSDHPLDLNGSYGGYSFKYNPNMPGNVEIVKESKGNGKDIFLFDYIDSNTGTHYDIVYVQTMSSNSGTHYYFHGVNLPELQIEMTQVKGDFIEDVIVKDGDLPTNGVKDGYWYVASDLAI